jgi:hypothetical protein
VKPEQTAHTLEERVGHPGEKWDLLKELVQSRAIETFTSIRDDWLDIMWTLDAYRIAGIPPSGMGNPRDTPNRRLGAVYRGKGHWFSELLSLLLQNLTSLHVASRQRVEGFSQIHQINVAWPARRVDPLICAVTRVTGAPPYGTTPARSSRADFASRRKELKFVATDLKLYRLQQRTRIDRWGAWRASAPPQTYFLWAARLKPGRDVVDQLLAEASALVQTYLDGVALVAWEEEASSYSAVRLPVSSQIFDLDAVLQRIADEINDLAGADRAAPPPVTPAETALARDTLPGDLPA